MEHGPQQPRKTRIEEARGVISRARESVKEEFDRTQNNWVSCAKSVAFQLELYLSENARAEFEEGEYEKVDERLEKLKIRLHELQVAYPEKENVPPSEVQNEVFNLIDSVL